MAQRGFFSTPSSLAAPHWAEVRADPVTRSDLSHPANFPANILVAQQTFDRTDSMPKSERTFDEKAPGGTPYPPTSKRTAPSKFCMYGFPRFFVPGKIERSFDKPANSGYPANIASKL